MSTGGVNTTTGLMEGTGRIGRKLSSVHPISIAYRDDLDKSLSDRLSRARRAIRVLSRFKVFRLSLIGNQAPIFMGFLVPLVLWW